ncbi:MAG: tRNA 2-thiouridine(34) synthase MnmA [Candidatus Pacebacteria bacterium]|nr:tRNA 2-thiouridine(34) synthase MnmA [Candidatus Paceibacterota bacterium]
MNLLKKIKNISQKDDNFFPEVLKENGKKTKIIVALSGGVDSSVALAVLKEKGYDVKGVYFKTYKPDGDRSYCRKEGGDAKRICEFLNVPFESYDLQSEYKEKVFDYMISEYKIGRTPNPDVFCNKFIKFGVFLEEALLDNADYIATGHYAKHFVEKENHFLVKSKDLKKDQTYFLSQISKKALEKSLFPIGDMEKDAVREKARELGLFTSDKKDSQGICFLQKEINLKKFLQNFIEKKNGDILNKKGERVGRHEGVVFHTIGQRQGFEISPKFKTPNQERLFVIAKDFENNILIVGTKEELREQQSACKKEVVISGLNLFNDVDITKEDNLSGRIRHRGELIDIEKISVNISGAYEIKFEKEQNAIASGQFLAIYQKDKCLGGGVIEK